MTGLLDLAAMCESATGSDRELDALIWLGVTPGATRRETIIPANETRGGWTIDETRNPDGRLIIVPAYTASIDAAMSLVSEGWHLYLTHEPTKDFGYQWFVQFRETAEAPSMSLSPALALCAAALKARGEQ